MQNRNEIKTGLLAFVACYLMWGFQPLYWYMCDEMDTMFLMACRIIMSSVCCLVILIIRGDIGKLRESFSSREIMKKEIPASVFLFADWIIYLIAVKSGMVLEVSLGYYIMPLVMFAFGAIFYKEKIYRIHIAVLAFVIAGIAVGTTGFGSFPYVTIALAICFSIYAAVKKGLGVDSVVSTTTEIILMAPIAIIYVLIFCRNETGLYALNFKNTMLVLGSGLVTGLPMVLYAIGLKRLPLMVTAISEYLSPTLSLICGLVMGETLNTGKILSFILIWIGIIIFMISSLRKTENGQV